MIIWFIYDHMDQFDLHICACHWISRLKAKTVAKLNSTEIDFWRLSARISRKDKIRNTIIKQKMNVTRSLLDDIKTQQLKWFGHVQRMEEGRLPKKSYEKEPTRKKKTS